MDSEALKAVLTGKPYSFLSDSAGSEDEYQITPCSSTDTEDESPELDAEQCTALLEEVREELESLQLEKESSCDEEEEELLDLDMEIVNDLINKVWKWCDEWDLQCSPDVKLKDVERELRLMAGDFFQKKKSIVRS
jgi:hypothetical protein